jgi:hypothetical protein
MAMAKRHNWNGEANKDTDADIHDALGHLVQNLARDYAVV